MRSGAALTCFVRLPPPRLLPSWRAPDVPRRCRTTPGLRAPARTAIGPGLASPGRPEVLSLPGEPPPLSHLELARPAVQSDDSKKPVVRSRQFWATLEHQ